MYFSKMKRIALLLAAILVMLTLTACGKDEESEVEAEGEEAVEEETELPSYLIGSENVLAFTADGAAVESVYTYTGINDGGALVEAYMGQMTAEENGFSVVGEDYLEADAPDFTAEEGTLRLSRTVADDAEHILVVSLSWLPDACTVTTSVEEKPEEPEQKPASSATALSFTETEDLISDLAPIELGLPGGSMSEYNFYLEDGLSLVDGNMCRCFNVYKVDENTHTNIYQGTYFISGDGQRLYIKDSNNVTTEITPD